VNETALLWVLNLSDGRHSLLDIAERSGLPFASIRRAATLLQDRGLLVSQPEEQTR
jgi:aminopeptidase-like protein